MPLSHDEITELRDTYSNLSAEELRGMRGDDDEQDALIDEILNKGKAVELEGGPLPTPGDDVETLEGEEGDEDDGQPEDQPENVVVPVAPASEEVAPVVEAPAIDIPQLDLSGLAEKYDQKLVSLDTANAEGLQKLMDGDLTAAEFAAQQAQYLRARDTLRDEKAAEAQWHQDVHKSRIAALADGVDYFNNAQHNEAWDDWVKRIAMKPEHADKSPAWVLKEAHKKVMAEFDIAAPTAKAGAKPVENVAPAKKVSQKTARTPNLSGIPPTLSGLPAAAPTASGDGGEFDHLATLTGFKFEQAIARMTPDQRARYEAE